MFLGVMEVIARVSNLEVASREMCTGGLEEQIRTTRNGVKLGSPD
jgi:hypothetical protein